MGWLGEWNNERGEQDRLECYIVGLLEAGLLELIHDKFGQPEVLPDPAMDNDLELVADRAEKYVAAFRAAVVELSEKVPDTFETYAGPPVKAPPSRMAHA
jgi:hypothetical protein